MLRTRALLLGVILAAGCHSDQTAQQVQRPPEIDSLKDEPTEEIRPETFVAAGDLAVTRNQFSLAASQYEKALKGKPQDASTIKKLALAYIKDNQMPAAIDAWKRYLSASNESAEAFGSLGYAYELAGNKVAAEETYQAGIAKHPQGALIRNNYGLMLVRNERVEEAVKQMSTVLKPFEVNYNIAGVYDQLGRKDLAQFYYRRALECDPNFYAAKMKLSAIE